MKLCPACKFGMNDSARFCRNCGFNIKEFEEENAKKDIFCPECGAKFLGGSFCPECGYDISAYLMGNSSQASTVGEGVDFDDLGDERGRMRAITEDLREGAEYGSVFFGSYYQSNSEEKEPIEWILLEEDGEKALFISKYALDGKKFSDYSQTHVWNNCSLRKWLNGEFFEEAFDIYEKAAVIPMPDKVSCADREELPYLDTEDRKCVPTPYAINQGVWCNGGYCDFWTREGFHWWDSAESRFKNAAHTVNTEGGFASYFADNIIGVRPIVWVDIDSDF